MKQKDRTLMLALCILLLATAACRRDQNKNPSANAGNDYVITLPVNEVTLDANASSDPDGTISSYAWTKKSGPTSFTIENATNVSTAVKNLVEGVYEFELTVTDNEGGRSADIVKVSVNPAVRINRAPVANAGPDQTITMLNSYTTASLNGRNSHDSSGMSLQFSWRQISGPSNGFLHTPMQAECMVYSLNTPGIYSFELKVWNNNGADLDTTEISVLLPTYCQAARSEVAVGLTFLSNLPGQIQDPEIIDAGNKLIIPAWFSNHSGLISNNIYMYDRIAQSWTTIQASQARIGVTTIAAGNKIFFAGGVDTYDDNYTATSVVDIYDLSTNSWSVTNLSEARGHCKAVVAGSKVFFAGGLKNNGVLSNKIDIYDLQTGNWSTAQLPGGARVPGAVVSILNKVFFCGGYTLYEDPTGFGSVLTTPTASIDIYDINGGQWSADTMQINKGGFAAIGVNEKIYFAGGAVNYAATFHVEELNVNTMNSASACLHQPMIGGNPVIKNDKIIFLANSGISGIAVNKFDIYNTQNGLWSVGVLPPDLISTNSYTPIAIGSANNEILVVVGTKLYKMNL